MIKKGRSRKAAPMSQTPVAPMTKEREKIQKDIERTYDKLRNKYPEIRGKAVDFVQQSVSDGIVYVGIRFTDKTVFSLRCGCDMLIRLPGIRLGKYRRFREEEIHAWVESQRGDHRAA